MNDLMTYIVANYYKIYKFLEYSTHNPILIFIKYKTTERLFFPTYKTYKSRN